MNEDIATHADTPRSKPWPISVSSRLFAWLHLGCALAAGAIWYMSDGRAGPWPLLIACLPWVARALNGHFPLPRTRVDPFLLIFIVSAAIGVWASYDQALASEKFWLIIGGMVLFYALAGQRAANLWPILAGSALFGGAVGLYFLLTHDWVAIPAKVDALNRIGLQIMAVRPSVLANLHGLHPNVAGGIMALLVPFALAAAVRAIRKGHTVTALMIILALGFMGIGLALTTSRGAWLALFGGLVAWLMWVGARYVADYLYLSRRKALSLGLLLLVGIGLTLVLLTPGGLTGVLDSMPGPASTVSRRQIAQDAIDLIGDYWLTGGGLGTFEGLYSQYILVIPFYAVIHSHNLFLNATIEQGVLGIISLIAVMALSLWWLTAPRHSGFRRSIHGFSLAAGATFAALVVICLHGLVDDPLYGSRGVLLLWFPAGLTALMFPYRGGWWAAVRSAEKPALVISGVVVALLALILVIFRAPILSTWHSSMGAIAMARVELVDYPAGQWSDGREVAGLTSARLRFEQALHWNQDNRTAWHRLGLIAMLDRDFETAEDALYQAYLLDRDHRGIRKSLAYAYVWAGNLDRAMELLKTIPEAEQELGNYHTWWIEQGDPELSRRAEEARIRIAEETTQ